MSFLDITLRKSIPYGLASYLVSPHCPQNCPQNAYKNSKKSYRNSKEPRQLKFLPFKALSCKLSVFKDLQNVRVSNPALSVFLLFANPSYKSLFSAYYQGFTIKHNKPNQVNFTF